MATARDLLQQAGALMRGNRLRDADREDATTGIPVLTEAVRSADDRPDGACRAEPGEDGKPAHDVTAAMGATAQAAVGRAGGAASANVFDDVPLLTDVVADLEAISVLGASEDAAEPSRWPDVAPRAANPDRWTAAVPADAPMPVWKDAAQPPPVAVGPDDDNGLAPPAFPAVEPVVGEGDADMPPAFQFSFPPHQAAHAAPVAGAMPAVPSSGAAPATAAAAGPPGDGSIGVVGDAARWESLAEEVRMQVLQRIDIFTDTGLQEQLTARLQPIVDRASADLVATINQHVGQLLRAYVAEAIEREIEKWRQNGA